MNKYLKYLSFCLTMGLVFAATGASAQMSDASGGAFEIATSVLEDTFYNVRQVIYIIGGFALIAMAVMSMAGKLRWGWFIAVAVALAIVAAAGAIVDYATGLDGNTRNEGQVTISFDDLDVGD